MEDVQNKQNEQRFLTHKGTEGPHLFNTDFEMHLQALIAALEMSPPPVAQRRAQEMMERLHHTLDQKGVDRTDVEAQMLLSAMVTFIDDKLSGQQRPLPAQDEDFVNYSWAILRKQLLKEISAQEGGASSASGVVPRPVRTETVEQGDLDVTEDELRLIRELEEEERRRDVVAKV